MDIWTPNPDKARKCVTIAYLLSDRGTPKQELEDFALSLMMAHTDEEIDGIEASVDGRVGE